MKQYKIEGKFNSFPKYLVPLLEKDKKWFYSIYIGNKKEENYMLLRVDKRNKKIEEKLKEKEYIFKLFPYSDLLECGKVTMKYFKYFIPIFHNLSLLMVKREKNETLPIFERVIHMGMNMANKSYWEESQVLSVLAMDRARIAGYYTR